MEYLLGVLVGMVGYITVMCIITFVKKRKLKKQESEKKSDV